MRKLGRAEQRLGLTGTAYCDPCHRGEDARPHDFDTSASRDVKGGRLRKLGRRIEEGAALHDRAGELLWSGELVGEAFEVWSLFVVHGLSDSAIARAVGRSRRYVCSRYLGPFRERCGYGESSYRAPKWRRGPNTAPADQACEHTID